MKHIAHTMPFDDLWRGLNEAKATGLIRERVQDDLHLFVYSEEAVYEKRWNPWTIAARGLILSPSDKKIVATPFPKFFNYGEQVDQIIPDCDFEALEKVDGSLIIIFHHKGEWRCATKGSLGSDQAKWAAAWLARHDTSFLDRDTTYLAEAIYPENRIVVRYDETGLVMLGAYRGDGLEMPYAELTGVADRLGWRMAKRHSFAAVSELLALAKTLPATEEGFVLRFSNGLRLKVKGDEYCRIHRMISRVTPLALWESMQAGDDMEAIRRELPEEFWPDFDAIIGVLRDQIASIVEAVKAEAEVVAGLTDKEVGLRLAEFPDDVRRFIFPYRKSGGDLLSGINREALFRAVRPTANILPGYEPSSSINRVMSEAA